jgi:O-antigen ligase
MTRRRRAGRRTGGDDAARTQVNWPERLTTAIITLLLIATPLIVVTDAKESFRLIKGLVAGWLGLASLAAASWSLRAAAPIDLRDVIRQPAIRALGPLLLVIGISGIFTAHRVHFHEAAADFAIGAASVVGWSLALGARTLRRLLVWTIPPAIVAAILGLDQSIGAFGALDWLHVVAPTGRLRLTSTLGNPGDLGALLVLPLLVSLNLVASARRGQRLTLAGAALVMVAALALTATLAAVAALAAGGLVLRGRSAHSPGHRRAAARAAFVVAAAVIAVVLAVPPLRGRIVEKAAQVGRGDINAVLTGRLDGWRAAAYMVRHEPLTGVGHGAFRAEYAAARLALSERGVAFFGQQHQVMMATPHNEALSVAAELGVTGLAALAWGIWCTARAVRRTRDPRDAALAAGGAAALVVLSLAWFPLHSPAVAWPWLVFLAWTFRASEEQ